jgi:hypothetical protein
MARLLRCVLAAALAALAADALLISVAPNDEECLYERLEKDNKLVGSFEVLSGGGFDIDAVVTGPDGVVHYKQLRQKTGSVQLCERGARRGAPARGCAACSPPSPPLRARAPAA